MKRPSPRQRGYTPAWDKAAKAHLARHPLCAYCEARGKVTAAVCVDHMIPHRNDKALFWDTSNWRSACAACHSAKTFGGEKIKGADRHGYSIDPSDPWCREPATAANQKSLRAADNGPAPAIFRYFA